MRRTFILKSALTSIQTRKKILLDGKLVNKAQLFKALEKHGHKITFKCVQEPKPAKEYKDIKVGTAYYGLLIWPREKKYEDELYRMLCDDDLISHSCHLPVEIRRDKE